MRDSCARRKIKCESWLAGEEAGTSNIDVACHTAFAGKPVSLLQGIVRPRGQSSGTL